MYTCVLMFSHVQLIAIPRTLFHQAPLSMGLSKQECWRGLPFPPPGDLPNPGIKPGSPALQADSLPTVPPGKPMNTYYKERVYEILYCSSVQFSSVTQSCLTLCDSMGCSPPGSSVHGIIQARILE